MSMNIVATEVHNVYLNEVSKMPVIKMPVRVVKHDVFKYLGYKTLKDQKRSPLLEKEIDKALYTALSIIKPHASYDYFNFSIDKENMKVIFKEGPIFSGKYIIEKLEKAEKIAAVFLTVGDQIEKRSADYFSNGDYLTGLIYDAIGSVALYDLKSNFFRKLCERARLAGNGLTMGLSPGSDGWPIEDQTSVFKLLDGESIGVTLKESMMMTPVKTISVVYGIGKELAIPDEDHNCGKCNLKNCQFRSRPNIN
jgi:hypothetical protein